MTSKGWIKAGRFAINADVVHWINAAARWRGEPDGDTPRDPAEHAGVEVVFFSGDRPLRFADGTPEAEDLRRFVGRVGP
jgi:hypothetical protein